MQSRHDLLLSLAALAALAFSANTGLSAQVADLRFADLHGPFPFVTNSVGQLIGDLDRDGAPDIVWFTVGGVLISRSSSSERPQLETLWHQPGSTNPTTGALTDFNGDGRLDIFVAADRYVSTNPTSVLIQLADGSFQHNAAPYVGAVQSVAVGDFNGDSHIDLFVGRKSVGGERDALLLGDGTGHLTDGSSALPPRPHDTRCVLAIDLDQDGDLDILKANYDAPNSYYRNDGTGQFQELVGLSTGRTPSTSMDAADFDGDGDLDLLVANDGGTGDELLRNDGSQRFQVVALPTTQLSQQARFVDLDGDGDQDILRVSPGFSELLENQGMAGYRVAQGALPAQIFLQGFSVVDLDGDRDVDLIACQRPGPAFALNNRGGLRFTVWEEQRPPVGGRAFAAGDIDGDGLPEIICSGRDWRYAATTESLRMLRNDGGGRLQTAQSIPCPVTPESAAIDDIDADGDNDLFVGGANALLWLRNTGGSLATPQRLPDPGGLVRRIRFADFDGDGDRDIVVNQETGQFYNQQLFYRNDSGSFQLVPGAGHSLNYRDIEVGDLDGDGDPDVVLSTGFYPEAMITILRNDGAFGFQATPAVAATIPYRTGTLAVADLNQDGKLDLAMGALGSVYVYLNQGGLSFPLAQTYGVSSASQSTVIAGDLDGDGFIDLACFQSALLDSGGFQAGEDGLLYGDGLGGFRLVLGRLPKDRLRLTIERGFGASTPGQAIDMDGDGDLDLVGGSPAGVRVHLNLAQQQWWRTPPRLGLSHRVSLIGQSGTPYVLALGGMRSPVAIPGLGTLHLGSPLFVTASQSFSAASTAQRSFAIPLDPSLLNTQLGLQVLHGSNQRLGNVGRLRFTAN